MQWDQCCEEVRTQADRWMKRAWGSLESRPEWWEGVGRWSPGGFQPEGTASVKSQSSRDKVCPRDQEKAHVAGGGVGVEGLGSEEHRGSSAHGEGAAGGEEAGGAGRRRRPWGVR